MVMMHRMFRAARFSAVALTALLSACGGGGESGGVTPPQTGTVVVSSALAALTATTTAPATTDISIVRGGGFTGAVTLTAENLPAGVTASFGSATLGSAATTTTMTLTVGPTATSGVTPITVRASGSGVTPSTLVINVTVFVPSIILTASAPAATVAQGGSTAITFTIARVGGFTGAVNLAVEGAPANVTWSFAPTSLAAGITTSTLTLNVGATAAVGATPITVRATGTGVVDRTWVIQLTVQNAPATAIDYTFCDASRVPVFLAVRDGLNGAWRRIQPNGNTFSFTFAGSLGSVALVWLNPLNRLFVTYETYMTVVHGTAAEWAAGVAGECIQQPARGKSLSGAMAPAVGAQELAFVSAGWGNALLNPGGTSFSLPDVAPTSIDLIATRYTFNAGVNGYQPTQMILRRGINLPNGAQMPLLDFAANEAFTPVSTTVTVSNTNGERVSLRSAFNPPSSAQLVFDNGIQSTATTHTQYSVPAARLQAGDLHEAYATAVSADNSTTRQVVSFSRVPTARTLTFGSVLNAPTLSVSNGVVARPRARGTLQPDYNKSAIALFTQHIARKHAWVQVSPGFLANATDYDLEVPDLTGVAGFNPSWGLTVGSPINYDLYVSNAPNAFASGTTGLFSLDGVSFLFASRAGIVP